LKEYIVILGNGGHSSSCIEILKDSDIYEIYGVISKSTELNTLIHDIDIVGTDDDLKKIYQNVKNAIIGIGQIENSIVRKELYKKLKAVGYNLPSIFSKRSFFSTDSTCREGNVFMTNSFVNIDAKIGKCNIINSNALIEHNVDIGDFNHVSTGSIVNGNVKIGNDVFIGSGSVIMNNISITDNVIVGAGSLVTKAIHRPGIYYGNPAKYIRGIDE